MRFHSIKMLSSNFGGPVQRDPRKKILKKFFWLILSSKVHSSSKIELNKTLMKSCSPSMPFSDDWKGSILGMDLFQR
jgi:hypothetical protein